MERRPAADASRRRDDLGETPVTEDSRWTLTRRGWCEAMGMSSAAQEAIGGVASRESCPQQPCTCGFLGEQLCPHYLRMRELHGGME